MKKILVTGCFGFLGFNAFSYFSRLNYDVTGIGRQSALINNSKDFDYGKCVVSDVTIESLTAISGNPDVIIHCAGSGSVGYSYIDPISDYDKNVGSLQAVLEYVINISPSTHLIMPSSAAIYGTGRNDRSALGESQTPNPVSPYGYHKLITELLCKSAVNNFNIKINIVRLFSLYGEGLRKQLFWDVCNRYFNSPHNILTFDGTGAEERDWLHISDALYIFHNIIKSNDFPEIINGGTGDACTINRAIHLLTKNFTLDKSFQFTGRQRTGDPQSLVADCSTLKYVGIDPVIDIEEGLTRYAEWYLRNEKN